VSTLEAWLIASFAVWRLTHLLYAEEGPWDLARAWRARLAAGPLARAVDCFNCLSLWVALPFAAWVAALAGHWLVVFAAWPALSGAAILIERLIERTQPAPPVWYEEPPPPPAHEDKLP